MSFREVWSRAGLLLRGLGGSQTRAMGDVHAPVAPRSLGWVRISANSVTPSAARDAVSRFSTTKTLKGAKMWGEAPNDVLAVKREPLADEVRQGYRDEIGYEMPRPTRHDEPNDERRTWEEISGLT